MNTLRDIERQHQRLAILQALSVADGYDLNSEILRIALKREGHRISRDQMQGELAWLAEQSLVTTEVVGNLAVATLTDRGEDVACGSATVPGIKKPRPSDVP